MEMGDQYGLPDLRRFLARRTHFPENQQASEPYFAHSTHRTMAPLAPYHEAFMVSNGMAVPAGSLVRFGHDHFAAGASAATTTPISASASSASAAAASGPCAALFGVEMESSTGIGWSLGNIDGGNSRWPRQETLTLLDIRSRLDSKFKEANQKGPLWDEVSRIMAEEHGYQRSGKKCREKFENLYKYYKKTKEGKAGRQDGKNYRFFRQLEALYGETSNNQGSSVLETQRSTLLCQTPMNQENQESLQEQKLMSTESLSFSNASEFETSSSENNDEDLSAIAFMMKQSMAGENQQKKKGWKTKVKDFVESQMKKLIDSQDVWMERMLKTIEDKEKERMLKEEEWRQQEAARFNKEHEFWAKERAWVEARDEALMDVLKKITDQTHSHNYTNRWTEHELSSLIHLRTSLESRFQESGYSKESLWEEIETKMVGLGHERDAVECKEKWEHMQMYFNMTTTTTTESYKKRKEDFRIGSNYFQQLDSCCDGQESNTTSTIKQRDSPSSSYVGTHQHQINDSNSFQMGLNQGDQRLWDRYGLKLSKGKNHQI